MTNSITPTLEIYSPTEQQRSSHSPQCMLRWRQGQLLVSLSQQVEHPYLPPLESEQGLVECLKHSPVRLVRVDLSLGETKLKFWADACEQADKEIFLRIDGKHELLKRKTGAIWWMKRLIEWIIAALLLLLLSPFTLGLAWLILSQSPGPLFSRQWCVGERGKLFILLKFRTTVDEKLHPQVMTHQGQGNLQKYESESNVTPIGHWMRKYRLHELPQLLNVLGGEIGLAGPHLWTLSDAVHWGFEGKQRQNELSRTTKAHLEEASKPQLELDGCKQ